MGIRNCPLGVYFGPSGVVMGGQVPEIPDDKKKVIKAFIEAGMPYKEIQELTGVALGTITKIKGNPVIKANKEMLALFKKDRGDIFARAGMKYNQLRDLILASMTDKEIEDMTPTQKIAALPKLEIAHGTIYDKERLEKGESTQNVHLIVEAITDLQKRRLEGKA